MIKHVIKRGGRGMPIVQDDNDRYRYLKRLYFLNDANHPRRWERDVDTLGSGLHFSRPKKWSGEREPYVDILSYFLHDNHHHLLLRERKENGISLFMKGLGASMTQAYNERHDGEGSIFQGRPKKRVVDTDRYLKLLYVYINVKNAFERYDAGLQAAIDNFDQSFNQALEYEFCSLADCMGKRSSSILNLDKFNNLFSSPKKFKRFAREQMRQYQAFLAEVKADKLE